VALCGAVLKVVGLIIPFWDFKDTCLRAGFYHISSK